MINNKPYLSLKSGLFDLGPEKGVGELQSDLILALSDTTNEACGIANTSFCNKF